MYKMTKKLKAFYPVSKPIHRVVADKIANRDPALAPLPGERIPYLLIQNHESEYAKKGEDYDYALANQMKPAIDLYFNRQLIEPLSRAWSLVDPEAKYKIIKAGKPIEKIVSPTKDVSSHFKTNINKKKEMVHVVAPLIKKEKFVTLLPGNPKKKETIVLENDVEKQLPVLGKRKRS